MYNPQRNSNPLFRLNNCPLNNSHLNDCRVKNGPAQAHPGLSPSQSKM
jgi:hypothetical protein